jgi:hypothetical protein
MLNAGIDTGMEIIAVLLGAEDDLQRYIIYKCCRDIK